MSYKQKKRPRSPTHLASIPLEISGELKEVMDSRVTKKGKNSQDSQNSQDSLKSLDIEEIFKYKSQEPKFNIGKYSKDALLKTTASLGRHFTNKGETQRTTTNVSRNLKSQLQKNKEKNKTEKILRIEALQSSFNDEYKTFLRFFEGDDRPPNFSFHSIMEHIYDHENVEEKTEMLNNVTNCKNFDKDNKDNIKRYYTLLSQITAQLVALNAELEKYKNLSQEEEKEEKLGLNEITKLIKSFFTSTEEIERFCNTIEGGKSKRKKNNKFRKTKKVKR